MQINELQAYLDAPETADSWMKAAGISNAARGMRNIKSIASLDSTLEFMCDFVDLACPMIRWTADPDMVLNSLERFFQASRSPRTLFSLFLQDRFSLSNLLEIFSTSQYLSDMLIGEPELFETVRQSDGRPMSQQRLTDELVNEVMALQKDEAILRAIRRFKRRQTLRIAFGDIIKKQPLKEVTEQISFVAKAAIEASLRAAGRKLFQKRGSPRNSEGKVARFTILALGKLGGMELNYSSDIDLIFLYDHEGWTDAENGRNRIENAQYFAELGREIVRFLAEPTELGFAYRVDMRLRPYGNHGPLAMGIEEAFRYYDERGRTWERQAFIKARPVAGSNQLGYELLDRLQPWIYRPNLFHAEIAEIRILKRRIEGKTNEMGETLRNVKTGYGGIRDIEFLVQFLQLLHGGDLPALRTGNTLLALDQLLNTGCVTQQEWELLSQGYSFLRKIEHRLQVMFDLQTHTIPEEPEELQKLALRMDYHVSGIDNAGKGNASATFLERFRFLTKANRNILDHVLNVFQNNEITAAEVDLLLDPQPKTETIQQILEKYGFEDCEKAYQLLYSLMDEKNPYLSVRRCRHFLIAVVPELLQEIGHTPQPDQALVMLDAVAEALGDKGGLWELFSSNKPSLALFVRLCAFAPFLTDMLRADPGMLDGLMDSLVLDKIPPRSILEEALARLCVNAEQLEPILAGFKHDHLLPIGVRNLLRRSTVRATNVAISDVAQVCLKQVVLSEYAQLVRRHGTPILARDETVTDAPVSLCRFAILGLGKFGGREMNYHSDLDILPLFEGDGKTEPVIWSERGHFLPLPHAVESIPNQLFFNKLVQVLVKRLSHFGPWGKLYEVDLRLRPMGKSGALATSLSTLEAYFMDGTGELWERQMLTKARIVANTDMKISRANFKHFRLRLGDFLQHVMRTVRMIQYAYPLTESDIKEMRHMRSRLVNSNDDDQLKRSSGGMIDVEFIVQMLQLKLGSQKPGIVVSNTFDTLEKMRATGIISEADYETLTEGYAFLCSLTNSMCLLNQRTTTQIPSDEPTQVRLAKLAGYESTEKLIAKLNQVQTAIANCFDRFFPG